MNRKFAYVVLPEVVAEAAKILLEGCNRVILYEDSMEEFNIPRTERYEKFNTEQFKDSEFVCVGADPSLIDGMLLSLDRWEEILLDNGYEFE